MEEILSNLILYFSNIWIGMGIAVAVSILLIGIVMVIPTRRPTPITYIICILLIPFVAYQASRIYGALTLGDYIETLVASANYVSNGISSVVANSNIMDNEFVGVLSMFVPGMSEIQDFISQLTTQGNVLIESVKDYINGYIIRRTLWLCLFLVISSIGIFFSLSKETDARYSSRRNNAYGETNRHRARTSRTHRY